MKVSVDISPAYTETAVIIQTNKMTQDIQRLMDMFTASDTPITAWRNEEDVIILKTEDIYMVRVENGNTMLYCKTEVYRSRRRLYELLEQMGRSFMQISKSAIVNLSHIDSVEPGFSGTLLLKMKNGEKEYVSRKYLPDFKQYLGL